MVSVSQLEPKQNVNAKSWSEYTSTFERDTRYICLVFQDVTTIEAARNPFRRFLKKGFSHVNAYILSNTGWVLLEPSFEALLPLPMETRPGRDLVKLLERVKRKEDPEAKMTPVYMEVKEADDMSPMRFSVMNCTTVMQYLIGVYWPFVITPHQLYSKLILKTPSHIRICHNGFTQCKEASEKSRKGREGRS